MEKNIEETQKTFIDDFRLYDDWADKYEYIIEMGKMLPEMQAHLKTDENLISGCQSKVWLHARAEDGKIYFDADSDAFITKGVISMLVKVYSGHTPKEIVDTDLHFINDIGLQEHLSPTRANGLVSMIKQIKAYAIAYHS